MNLASVIDAMVKTGCTAEQIAAVVRVAEAERAEQEEAKRAMGRERVRRHREMKRDVTLQSVTERYVTLPPPSPSQDKEIPPTPPKENPTLPLTPSNISVGRKRPTPSDFFDRFKAGYPKREGANPWQPALKAFNRAVDAGADPEDIIRGAQIYRSQQAGKDARFVAQAVTWLNQERWNDHTPTPSNAPTGPPPTRLSREEVEAQVRAFGLIK